MGNAIEDCGMVPAHAGVFANVAKKENIVIISRQLNLESTALLIENYAAKGFHVKAKTCNWGPMAGFVCADARFVKEATPEKINGQKSEILKAIKAGASKTQICISDKRLKSLTGKQFDVTANATIKVTLKCKFPNDALTFVAIAKPKVGWALYYSPEESKNPKLSEFLPDGKLDDSLGLMPLYAMVNPKSGSRGHLDAIAGDYDLFALYPKAGSMDADHHTNRAVEGKAKVSDNASPRIKELAKIFIEKTGLEKEHEHLGNITPVILKIKKALNEGIKGTGYTGGEIVMHSDESGNPFSSAPDYPLLAFIPDQPAQAIRDQKGFVEFIKTVVKLGYRATLNPAWKIPNFSVELSGKEVR